MAAKILIFDIETAPLSAYVWGIWKQNVGMNMLRKQWYMLTWAAKWLGEDTIHYDSNHLHGDPKCDKGICESLHAMIDKADIVVAHNGNKFDIKKMNARFLFHGMDPPSPVRKIDTLLEARKYFALTSNRLDEIGKFLGVGQKMETGGWKIWEGCMDGDIESFETMVKYNIQDVHLLENVYVALRPWMQNHPNIAVFDEAEEPTCPKCGSDALHYRGYTTTQAGRYHRFRCMDCGGWGRDRLSVLEKEKRKSMKMNVQ
jgi:hypothetical protein